jgi:protein-S-isoprenylcysteine O-methyltransferase Ste14
MTTAAYLQAIGISVMFIANFVLFSIALKRTFSRPEGIPLTMRMLMICGVISAITDVDVLLSSTGALWRTAIGAALLIASRHLFAEAEKATSKEKLSIAFSSDSPIRIYTAGPYRVVRHPFYTSYLLTWLGVVVTTANIISTVPLLVMGFFYVNAAMLEESRFLRSPLKIEYETYQQITGMFIPIPPTFKKDHDK